LNQLTDDEIAVLEPQWRKEYEKATAPGFMYCIGTKPGQTGAQWLKGEAARDGHLKWAGVPREYIRKFDDESARESRAI
jgi:hypothetical protein